MKSKKRKTNKKRKTKLNIIKNDAIVINKNGSRIFSNEFNEKILNITQKASKYSFDSRLLGNFIINSEMKKNI